MNAWCAAVCCSIATKMASVKQVRDYPASHLTDSGANLLHFKIHQFPMTQKARWKIS